MLKYVGHQSQLYGVEEHRLCGGKGDGMRLFEVNNGRGIMFTISADRCGDISRIYFNGKNLGFFAPCGYVSPQYYDKDGFGFLKSFTAGFITTCGLTNVGAPCNDDGEELPQHGTIANIPAENVNYWIDDDAIHVKLTVRDAALFSHKLVLTREYICSLNENEIVIKDSVKNIDDKESPFAMLYHMNIGYPLLSENAEVTIKNKGISARSEISKQGIDKALVMEKPQPCIDEQCFFYDLEEGLVKIYNPDIKTELSISFNLEELPYLTEWKLMNQGQYVLGIEPGTCTPRGRIGLRESGELLFLKPGEEKTHSLTIKLSEK